MATSINAPSNKTAKKPARNVVKALRRSEELSRRVQAVGIDKFAFVCVDPAKACSRWMMTDFFGKPFIEPTSVQHVAGQLRAAVALVQAAVQVASAMPKLSNCVRTVTMCTLNTLSFLGSAGSMITAPASSC